MNSHQRSVTVDRLKLIEQLKVNLAQHKIDYAEAVVGYRLKLMDDLEVKLYEVKACTATEALKVRAVQFAPPQSYEKEYVDAIAMLEWSVSDTIELDQTLFKQYVQNEWGWSQNFEIASSMYKTFALDQISK